MQKEDKENTTTPPYQQGLSRIMNITNLSESYLANIENFQKVQEQIVSINQRLGSNDDDEELAKNLIRLRGERDSHFNDFIGKIVANTQNIKDYLIEFDSVIEFSMFIFDDNYKGKLRSILKDNFTVEESFKISRGNHSLQLYSTTH
jgi:hypothetical protein